MTIKERGIQLVAGEIPAILSSWEHTRLGGMTAVEDAIGLLAAWAHLQRFRPEDRPEIWTALDQVVQRDKVLPGRSFGLVELALAGLNPEGWVEAVKDLGQLIDNANTDDLVREAQDEALLLFRQLDQADLAEWSMIQLRGEEEVPGLAELGGGLCRCNGILAEELSLFFGARFFAKGLLEAYRTEFEDDVLGAEEALSAGIEKYRLLAEECEAPPIIPFTREEWEALVHSYKEKHQ